MNLQINPSPKEINWKDHQNYIFIHPSKICHIPEVLKNSSLQGHLWVVTSGTQAQKYVALSKEAFLNSARIVNEHLQTASKDRWLVALPLFHVGGLSILARSFLSRSRYFIFDQKWHAQDLISYLKKEKITLTSLVPTQVYDIVSQKIKAPDHLRAVVVGGGRLHKNLYFKARKLRWPLLPSYGLTEVSSQVATATLDSLKTLKYPSLKILNGFKIRIQDSKIIIQSPTLLTGWIQTSSQQACFDKLKNLSEFRTEDFGKIDGNFLEVLGRRDIFKVNGYNVSMNKLENVLVDILIQNQVSGDYQLITTSHPRTQHQIALVTTQKNLGSLTQIIRMYNQKMASFEKISHCYLVDVFQKTSTSKTKINSLKKFLELQS